MVYFAFINNRQALIMDYTKQVAIVQEALKSPFKESITKLKGFVEADEMLIADNCIEAENYLRIKRKDVCVVFFEKDILRWQEVQ